MSIAIIMEDYPSLIDLTMQIQLFCNSQTNHVNCKVEYKNNWCSMIFENENDAIAFMQFINQLKSSNQLYSKLKIKKGSDDGNDGSDSLSNKNRSKIQSYKAATIPSSKSQLSIKSKNLCRSLLENPTKEKLKKYFADQVYIRNSSPYLSEDDKQRMEMKKNKRYWIARKGFFNAVGNNNMKQNDIKNFVNATPSESPLVYKFRRVNKTKWISGNGFI